MHPNNLVDSILLSQKIDSHNNRDKYTLATNIKAKETKCHAIQTNRQTYQHTCSLPTIHLQCFVWVGPRCKIESPIIHEQWEKYCTGHNVIQRGGVTILETNDNPQIRQTSSVPQPWLDHKHRPQSLWNHVNPFNCSPTLTGEIRHGARRMYTTIITISTHMDIWDSQGSWSGQKPPKSYLDILNTFTNTSWYARLITTP